MIRLTFYTFIWYTLRMNLMDEFTVSVFARKRRMHFTTDLHKHRSLELFYILNGIVECELYPENSANEKKTVTLTSGQFILLPSLCLHRLHIIGECEYMMCELSCTNTSISVAEFLQHEHFIGRIPDFCALLRNEKIGLSFNDTANVADSFSQLLDFLGKESDGDVYRPIEYELRLYDLFFRINKCSQVLVNLDYGNRYLAKATAFINENYTKQISISDIASFVGISPAYLQSLFKSSYGKAAFFFVQQNRLLMAEQMLVSTRVPVSHIALRVGYRSLRAFQFAFTKQFGTTPTEYRENSRKYFHVTKVADAVVYDAQHPSKRSE